MSIAIKAENVSKMYRLGQIGTGTLSNDLKRRYALLRGKEDPFSQVDEVNDRTVKGNSDVVWSLKDINFEIKQGDAVGIIGRNGAGKSTLLKILSRITGPTTGKIIGKGRVASLLEVGTGFHPELTGRENIYLNGAILGMRKKEIARKLDAIVDFAGVQRYVDTPVKRYSSGMYVRLAFAVAAHLESEILIVDEVLAVGDAEFQKKCLGKMNEVSKGEGKTILFVSHNMDAVSTLTQTSILLNNGYINAIGKTSSVISTYQQISKASQGIYVKEAINRPCIVRAEIKTSQPNGIQNNGEQSEVSINIFMPEFIEGMALSVQICNEKDLPVVHLYAFDTHSNILRGKGLFNLTFLIPECRLYVGRYYLRAHLAESKGKSQFDSLDKICEFEVQMTGSVIEWGWQPGACVFTEKFKVHQDKLENNK